MRTRGHPPSSQRPSGGGPTGTALRGGRVWGGPVRCCLPAWPTRPPPSNFPKSPLSNFCISVERSPACFVTLIPDHLIFFGVSVHGAFFPSVFITDTQHCRRSRGTAKRRLTVSWEMTTIGRLVNSHHLTETHTQRKKHAFPSRRGLFSLRTFKYAGQGCWP